MIFIPISPRPPRGIIFNGIVSEILIYLRKEG
jgi:hypothetical protein